MRKSLAWLLVLLVLLAGCVGKKRASAPALGSGSSTGPVAEATMEGTGIRFFLRGYEGKEMPSLKLTAADGTDWSSRIPPPERDGQAITVKLPGERGTANLAVEQFDYAWTLPGGGEVKGAIQFRDYRYRDMEWQMTRTEKLLVYHVHPLRKSDAEVWEKSLQQVLTWTGQTRGKPLVIWVFPDSRTLNDWARYGVTMTIAGQWRGDVDRLLVYDKADSTDRQVIMLHEMVHAVTPGHMGPPWFNEGAATLFEARQERNLDGGRAQRWRSMEYELLQLQETARKRAVDTSEALGHKDPPTDPYTLGVSVWLFVKHYRGEDGVKRFFWEGGQENGVKVTLESLFGESLPDVWEEWNEYLRSSDLLADWQNP